MIFVVRHYEDRVLMLLEIKCCFCQDERFGLLSGLLGLLKTLFKRGVWNSGIISL